MKSDAFPADEETLRNLERQPLMTEVDNALTLYMSERNGLLIWRAFRLLHEAGQPIPANILAKFAEWAAKLEQVSDTRDIALALELSGGSKSPKGSSRLEAAEHRRSIASEVNDVAKLYGMSINKAIEVVSKNQGMGKDSVRSAYFSHFRPRKQKTPAGFSRSKADATTTLDSVMAAAWRSDPK